MLPQDMGEIIENFHESHPIIILDLRLEAIIPKRVKPRMESMMLFHIPFHQAGLFRSLFNVGKEIGFFVVAMVLYCVVPAAAVEEDIPDVVWGRDVGSLVMDAVEGAEEGIVGVGHVCGHGYAVVGYFQGTD